jgi:hypothetical protein
MANEKFLQAIEAYIDETEMKMDTFLRFFCSGLQREIMRRNPVLTGFSRASWYTSVDRSAPGPEVGMVDNPHYKQKFPGGGIDYRKQVPDAKAAKGQSQRQTYNERKKIRAGKIVYIMNNCVYIRVLEYESKHQGFVRDAVSSAARIGQEALAKCTNMNKSQLNSYVIPTEFDPATLPDGE